MYHVPEVLHARALLWMSEGCFKVKLVEDKTRIAHFNYGVIEEEYLWLERADVK